MVESVMPRGCLAEEIVDAVTGARRTAVDGLAAVLARDAVRTAEVSGYTARPISEHLPGTLLETHALACRRDDRLLFSELSLRLADEQLLLIEGSNGSGKTSLLRLLCGLRRPDAGQVFWLGEDIACLGSRYLAQIAYVGHLDAVKQDLTVRENLDFANAIGTPRAGALEMALDAVGLAACRNRLARTLSAGQRRRLALARLLVTQARLWILDEPFTAMDRHGVALIERLLRHHLEQGGLVVMTSHQPVHLPNADVQRLVLGQGA